MIQEYTREEALRILHLPKEKRQVVFQAADELRKNIHGDGVPLRGIVEFSNICRNDCLYCGIRKSNKNVARYRLDEDEILAAARRLPALKHGTLVLQAGEVASPEYDRMLGEIIKRVKAETGLVVTLSVGNRPKSTYAYWQECGMNRYLLRFETSSAELFSKIHPDCTLAERVRCLKDLKSLGVETGSGFMVGLPGETDEILADNICLCRELKLDMIGFGPFIPSPGTPMADTHNRFDDDKEMFYVVLSALRLFNPDANIPATTAFDAVFPGIGRLTALKRGANVFMPNATPACGRESYKLYPGKPSVDAPGAVTVENIEKVLIEAGRHVIN